MLGPQIYSHGIRRILLQTPLPPSSMNASNFTDNPPPFSSTFDMGTQFTPSMAIILVVLLSAFFFMAFFSVYVRRCTTDRDHEEMNRNLNDNRASPTEQQGLDPTFIANLPMLGYSASVKRKGCNECVVCLSDFEKDQPLKMLPKCKHVFHPQCIDMWLFSHTTCPLCRRSVSGGGSTRSFRWGSRRASLNEGGSSGSDSSRRPRVPERPVMPPSHSEIQVLGTDCATGARPPIPPPKPLRRSHSTGHNSIFRRAWSRATGAAAGPTFTIGSGCEAATPRSMHRSMSISGTPSRDAEELDPSAYDLRPRQLSRGWSLMQLKRVFSVRALPPDAATLAAFSAPVGQAATSSVGLRTFEKLGG